MAIEVNPELQSHEPQGVNGNEQVLNTQIQKRKRHKRAESEGLIWQESSDS